MISFRMALAGVLFVGVLGAAGLVWQAWPEVASVVETSGTRNELCSTLDEDERMDLAGVETPVRLTGVEGSLDPYTCRWATEDYERVTAFVEVVQAPADEWALEIQRVMRSSGTGWRAGGPLGRAARQPVDNVEDGCRFARALFEASGEPAGTRRLVAPTSTSTGVGAMMAQSCMDGTYTAVMVAAPALRLDRPLERRTARTLRTVEQRLG